MFRSLWRKLFTPGYRPATTRRATPRLATMEQRIAPAVAAAFAGGKYTITLTGANETATLKINGANLEVLDKTNTVIESKALATVTDIEADGDGSANQTVAFANALTFSGTVDVASVTAITTAGNLAGDTNLTFTAAGTLNFANQLSSANGSVTVTTTTGNLTVAAVTAKTDVKLTASAGSIVDGNAAANNITATSLVGAASTGIDLDTTVTNLTATSTTGNITIDEADGANVLNVVATAGDVTVTTATGDLTVTTVTAGGNVTLTATTGNIFDDGVDATLITGGIIALTADRSIGQPGATADMDTAANSWTLKTTGPGPFVGAPTPGIWVTDVDAVTATSATTNDGVILLGAADTAAGKLTATLVTAGGTGRNVRLLTTQAGSDIELGSITATGDIVSVIASGAITDGNAAANNVTSGSLLLVAGTGVGAADALETSVDIVAGETTAGNFVLVNDKTLTVGSVTAFGASRDGVKAGGDVTITVTTGDLNVTTVTGGSVTLTATAGKITDANAGANNVTATSLIAQASTGIDLDTTVTNLTATSTTGNITIDEADGANVLNAATAGDVTITTATGDLNVSTVSGASVALTATAGKITDANAGANNVTATSLVAKASTGIDLDTTVINLTATSTTGNITIDEADGANVLNVATAGDVTVTSTTGDLIVTTVSGVAVTLTATAGNIFDDGVDATLISGDVVTLTADRSIGQPGATADMDTAANSWKLKTTGPGPFVGAPTPGIWVTDVDAVTATSATTNDGVILLGAADTAAGKLTATLVTAGGTGRNVRLLTTQAGSDIELGTITASGDIVSVIASGAITDGNAAANNVTAGSLLLVAGTGVGAADALETSVDIVAGETTAGNFVLINDKALTVGSVTAFGLTRDGVKAGGDVTITVTTGDLNVSTVSGGSVTLTATAGKITDANAAVNNITATTLVATASTGIDLDTTVTNLTATSTTGNITIDEADGANALNVATAGDVTVTTTTGDLNVTTVSGGSVTLTATAGKITDANAAVNNITATSLIAQASTGIDLDTTVTNLTATSATGNVTIDEADGANVLNAATAGDVTVTTTTGDLIVTTVSGVAVTLTATAGNIFDDGVDATLISGDVVTLTADRSIGQPGATADMDTAANSWKLKTTGPGPFVGAPTPGIWVTDFDAVTASSATTNDGVILLGAADVAPGKLTATLVMAGGTGRNVRLLTTQAGSDIELGTVTATGDIVSIIASGAITDGNGATNNVTAGSLLAIAGTGVGDGDALETSVDVVAGETTAGKFQLINDKALQIGTVAAFGASRNGIKAAGDINITVDAIDVTQQLNSGDCVVIQPLTATTPLRLGANKAGELSLDQTELDFITADIFQFGSAIAGTATIEAPVTLAAAKVPTLDLRTAAGVNENAGAGSLTVTNLAVQAGDTVTLDGKNAVGTLAANVTGVLSDFTFVDDGTDAVTVTIGSVSVCNAADVVGITAPGDITIIANDSNITKTINGDCVIFERTSAGDVTLGVDLSAGELAAITAKVLQIGVANVNSINVSAAINVATNVTNFHLKAKADITAGPAGTITAKNLAADAPAGKVTLGNGNSVNTLAVVAKNEVVFVNTTALTVDSVALCPPLTTLDKVTGSDVKLTATSLTLNQAVTATATDIALTADAMKIAANVDASAGGCVSVLQLSAATNIDLGTDSAGKLSLEQGEINFIKTKLGLRIGTFNNVPGGSIAVTAANLTFDDPLWLQADGDVATSGGTLVVAGTGLLRLNARQKVDVTGANKVLQLDGTAGTSFRFANDQALVLDKVTICNATSSDTITAGTDFVDISSKGKLTVNAQVLGASSVTLATKTTGDLLVNEKVTATAGNTALTSVDTTAIIAQVKAGDDVSVNAGANISITAGGIQAGAEADNAGAVTLVSGKQIGIAFAVAAGTAAGDVSIKATNSTFLTADVTANLGNGTLTIVNGDLAGTVNQTAGTVKANLVHLEGKGTFVLSNPFVAPGIRNDANFLTVNTQGGQVRFTDDNNLTIGAAGIITNGQPLQLVVDQAFNHPVGVAIDIGAANGSVQFDFENLGKPVAFNGAVKATAPSAFFIIAGDKADGSSTASLSNQFNITPTKGTSIVIFGAFPTLAQVKMSGGTIPGDSLAAPGGPGTVSVKFLPSNADGTDGQIIYYDGPNFTGSVIGDLHFHSIEQFNDIKVRALAVVQKQPVAGPGAFDIFVDTVFAGKESNLSLAGVVPALAPFVAAPQFTDPTLLFRAPQILQADVNGDGRNEVIIGFGPNTGGPVVTVIDGNAIFGTGALDGVISDSEILGRFFAFEPEFQGGISLAAADLDNDGRDEIVVGTGQNHKNAAGVITTDINVFSQRKSDAGFEQRVGTAGGISQVFPNFAGGVRVATGDVNGDGTPDIIAAAGPGGGPHVRTFALASQKIMPAPTNGRDFNNVAINIIGTDGYFAYGADFRGGVYVDAADVTGDGKADILTGAGSGAGPHIRVFDLANHKFLPGADFFDAPDEPGTPSFEEQRTYDTAGIASIAFGDYNDDGIQDIFVGSGTGRRSRIRVYTDLASTAGYVVYKGATLADGLNIIETDVLDFKYNNLRYGVNVSS